MAAKLEDIIAKMTPARRARVERQTKELIAEELARRDRRKPAVARGAAPLRHRRRGK